MNSKLATTFAAILFLIVAGCGGGTDSTTTAPPPPAAPAASSGIDGYEVVQVADGGSISGTISVSGALPTLAKRPVNKDPGACGTAARDSQQLLVNNGGLRNVFVVVQNVKSGKALPEAAKTVQINQKNCEYDPHVLVVPVKTEMSILNSDPILHNIHMYQDDESLFNIAQPVQNQENKHALEKPGYVYTECDVHGWMQAHVMVVDNPYYAVTDADGKFTISDLPAGSYKVKIWHEYLGEKEQDVNVAAGQQAALNLDLRDMLDAKLGKSSSAAPTAAPAAGGDAKAAAPADAKAGAAKEVVIRMVSVGTGFRFEPENVTIKAGTTIKWENDSENRHSATGDPKFEKKAGQAVNPSGSEPWNSPFLATGDTFSRTFAVPGKYRYFCRNHEQFGMIANITVTP